MSVGKNSISRVSKKEVAASEEKVEAPIVATKSAPAKKAPAKVSRHGNYVLITEELPVWLL